MVGRRLPPGRCASLRRSKASSIETIEATKVVGRVTSGNAPDAASIAADAIGAALAAQDQSPA